MKLNETETFLNWQTGRIFAYFKFEKKWQCDDLNLLWEKTVQLNEVPENDKWDIFTTDQKIEMQNLLSQWGYDENVTEHFMCLDPVLNDKFDHIFEKFKDSQYHYNLLKLHAGKMLAWHRDFYSWFIKTTNYKEEQQYNIKRTIVMLDDWNFGQVIQIGGEVLHNWKAGDAFTWSYDTWHGACNFGNQSMTVLQITHD